MVKDMQLVYSKAGKDKGKPFFVLKDLGNQYLLLVDGKQRPIQKPKKKKKKHVQETYYTYHNLANCFQTNTLIEDKDIRKVLAKQQRNH